VRLGCEGDRNVRDLGGGRCGEIQPLKSEKGVGPWDGAPAATRACLPMPMCTFWE
jgi:hypothetical protein